MKRISYHVWLWSVSMLGLTLAQAQNSVSVREGDQQRYRDQSITDAIQNQPRMATPLQRSIWLSELQGMKVQDSQGSEIGTVDDVVVDLVRGRIPHVIVRTGGGFLGLGGRSVAIPAQHIERSPYRNFLTAHVSRDHLTQFPQTDGKSRNDQAWNQLVSNYRSAVGADRSQEDFMNRGTQSAILRRGNEIKGENVYSPTNVELGEVSDLLVQLDQNRVLLTRIQSNEGEGRMVVVPPLLFYTSRDGQSLRIDSERNQLFAAPRLELREGTAISPTWLSNLYQHFRINAQNVLAGIVDETMAAGQEFADRLDTTRPTRSWTDQGSASRGQKFTREMGEDSSDLLNNQRQATRYREQFPDRNREFTTEYRSADQDSTWDRQWRDTADTRTDSSPAYDSTEAPQSRDVDPSSSMRGQNQYSDQRAIASRSASTQRDSSLSAQVRRLLRSNEVLGKEVRNFQGRTIGEVRDVVINLDRGQITHLVLARSQGGLFSRSQPVALPLQLARNSENWDFFLVDLSPDLLSESPQFDKNRFRSMSNANWIQDVNQFFIRRVPGLENQLRSLAQGELQSVELTLLSDLMGQDAQWTGGASAGEVRDVIMDLAQGRVTGVLISPRLSPEYWTSYPITSLQRSGNRFLLDSSLADRRYQTNPENWTDREGRVMTRESTSSRSTQ